MKKGVLFLLISGFFLLFSLGLPGCGGGEGEKDTSKTDVSEDKDTKGGSEKTGDTAGAGTEDDLNVKHEVDKRVKKWVHYFSWKNEGSAEKVAEALLELSNLMKDGSIVEDVKSTIPQIKELLEDPRELVKGHAALALAKIGGKAMAGSIQPLLQDESEEVRLKAIDAISGMNDMGNLNLFIQSLDDDSSKVASSAVRAIARLRADGAASRIKECIEFAVEDELIREGIKALVQLKYAEAAPVIAEKLSVDSEGVRIEAAKALSRLPKRSYTILKRLIKAMEVDDVQMVRKYAFEAFQTITGQEMGFDYDSDDEESRIEEMIGFRDWLEQNKNLYKD